MDASSSSSNTYHSDDTDMVPVPPIQVSSDSLSDEPAQDDAPIQQDVPAPLPPPQHFDQPTPPPSQGEQILAQPIAPSEGEQHQLTTILTQLQTTLTNLDTKVSALDTRLAAVERDGEESDIEEEPLSTRKRKTLAGPESEGPSGTAGSSSKKQKTTAAPNTVNPAELAVQWGVSVDTVLEWLRENNQAKQQRKIAKKDARLIQRTLEHLGTFEDHVQRFNKLVKTNAAQPQASEPPWKESMLKARFANFETRRVSADPIIGVKATKPNDNKILTLHITRQGGIRGKYTETLFASELFLSFAEKQSGRYGQELKVALVSLIEKAQQTKRSPTNQSGPSSSSVQPRRPRVKDSTGEHLLPYGTDLINNTLPQGVDLVEHQCILEPEHGIFYLDAQGKMCFQRTSELQIAPTSHLVDLRDVCLPHKHIELGYHALISLALVERRPELREARDCNAPISVRESLRSACSASEDPAQSVRVLKRRLGFNRSICSAILASADSRTVIKSFDMDVKQHEINRAGYNPSMIAPSQPSSSSYTPNVKQPQTYSARTSSYVPAIHTGPMSKGVEENLALMTGLIGCYNALVTGELAPPVLINERDQIHPDDVEEMDISWQIGMALFRAKKFTQRSRRNTWGIRGDRKMGLNKCKLRCFNCHEEGHFARECTKPKVEHHNYNPNHNQNNVRTMVPAGNNNRDAPANNDRALVAQKFDWEDPLQTLNLGDHHATNLAQIDEAEEAEDQMMELQHAFMVMATPEKEKVSETSCSPSCSAKLKSCREQIDLLIREGEDLKYHGYTLRKSQKPLKEKLEGQTKDFNGMQEELSVKNCQYKYVKNKIELLTAELDTLKAKFKNADFNFKKFEVSSTKFETMIENHLKFKDQTTEGLGYNNVPPPFNDNYTPPLEPETGTSCDIEVNVINASTSCVDSALLEDWNEEEDSGSDTENVLLKTNDLNSIILNNYLLCDVKPAISVSSISNDFLVSNDNGLKKPYDKCKCTCGASGTQKQSSNHDLPKSRRPRPSPQLDRNILKRQTCFCCGIAGHIARNCSNPPPMPVHPHHLKNISKGDSSNRKSSRPCSNDSDWNANKAKTRTLPDKNQPHFGKSNLRDSLTKPKSVRSKPSQRPSHSQHLKPKPKSKGRPISKSSVEAPIPLTKRPKPIYRWVPKVQAPTSPNNPVTTSFNLHDK
ncbi:hypothetical protein LXL04_007871 [Taraxacum kok-saghyz]